MKMRDYSYRSFAAWMSTHDGGPRLKLATRQLLNWAGKARDDKPIGRKGLSIIIAPIIPYIKPNIMGQPVAEDAKSLVRGEYWIEAVRDSQHPDYLRDPSNHKGFCATSFWLTEQGEWLYMDSPVNKEWRLGHETAAGWRPGLLISNLGATMAQGAEDVVLDSSHRKFETNLGYGFNRFYIASLYRAAVACLPEK